MLEITRTGFNGIYIYPDKRVIKYSQFLSSSSINVFNRIFVDASINESFVKKRSISIQLYSHKFLYP